MRRILMALAAACVIAVGISGTPAQAHEFGWGGYGWGGYGWHHDEWREQAWSRYEKHRHDERMAAIISHAVPQLLWSLSHHY